MSETRDKRRKSDLDLFVLALIDEGVSTPYALQKEAGLSPGATIPAIQRMLDAGLIRQGTPGVRGRKDCRITAAGKKQLKHGWQMLIEEGPSGDLDADLRVALLAITVGNAYSLAIDLLSRSAAKLHELGQVACTETESSADFPLASLYRELRTVSARALLEGRAAAVATIAGSLPRKLSGRLKVAGCSPTAKDSPKRVKRLR